MITKPANNFRIRFAMEVLPPKSSMVYLNFLFYQTMLSDFIYLSLLNNRRRKPAWIATARNSFINNYNYSFI